MLNLAGHDGALGFLAALAESALDQCLIQTAHGSSMPDRRSPGEVKLLRLLQFGWNL